MSRILDPRILTFWNSGTEANPAIVFTFFLLAQAALRAPPEVAQSSKQSGFWDLGPRTLFLKSSDIFG